MPILASIDYGALPIPNWRRRVLPIPAKDLATTLDQPSWGPAMQVNLHDAKTHLSRYVDQALAGKEVVIARAGKPAEIEEMFYGS
jgi:hypothetical protein